MFNYLSEDFVYLQHLFFLHVCVDARSYPGDYGEEREGDSCPGCVRPLVEWQLIRCGPRPLIGQEAETYEVQEGPETCQDPAERQHFVTAERSRQKHTRRFSNLCSYQNLFHVSLQVSFPVFQASVCKYFLLT